MKRLLLLFGRWIRSQHPSVTAYGFICDTDILPTAIIIVSIYACVFSLARAQWGIIYISVRQRFTDSSSHLVSFCFLFCFFFLLFSSALFFLLPLNQLHFNWKIIWFGRQKPREPIKCFLFSLSFSLHHPLALVHLNTHIFSHLSSLRS